MPPIFEFNCDKCGDSMEKIMSYDESEKFKKKCKCKKGTYRKKAIAQCNFALKGRWYKTTRSY